MGRCLLLLLSLTFSVATALPLANAEDRAARTLLDEGRELLAQDKLSGALAKVRSARRKAKEAKILLSIAATFIKLDHSAEAAEVYEEYLVHPNSKKRRRRDVQEQLQDLEERVGRLKIRVDPSDAKITVGDRRLRTNKNSPFVITVDVGPRELTFSKKAFVSQQQSVNIVAGRESEVAITLVPESAGSSSTTNEELLADDEVKVEDEVEDQDEARDDAVAQIRAPTRMPWELPSRKTGLMALVGLHADVENIGAAGLVGLSYTFNERLSAVLAGIVGKERGAYLGARILAMDGEVTPVLNLGVLTFFAGETDPGVRGGAGMAWGPLPRLWFTIDMGVEYYPKNSETYLRRLFVPSLSVEGWL